MVRFYEDVIERLRRAPGVINASAVSAMPLHDVGAAGALPFNVEGQQPPTTEDPLADVRIVAPGYFETMKIQLLAGRFLDERDDEAGAAHERHQRDDGAAVLSGSEPARARSSRTRTARAKWWASSRDVHNQGLDSEPKKQVYLPLRQSPTAGMAVVARTERRIPAAIGQHDPAGDLGRRSGAADLRAEHDGSDPGARGVPAAAVSTTLLATFALAALLLAALGIYGVLSYSVSQRTREIGLRMALGASGGNTVALIVRNSVLMVAIGGVVGLVAATLLARSMAGILYGVGPFDVPSFAMAAVTLLIAGVLASLLPALRTTRVDPVVALREQ